MILDKVNSPDDVKTLSTEEMKLLADEIRPLIINKVNTIGGHMGPNLGIVEATIALHYVFNSPEDKFIFDVSHQCYTHKILTGRKEGFTNPEKYMKYTGYTAPEESVHDIFKVGHTSTSVSLATGTAKARDLKKEKYNVIALIGDGSLSGGEAFEGFDNAATLGTNMIIIVNDNDMSIAENHGGLYSNLKLLRETEGKAENNFFKTLGFDYLFVKDGNDIEQLIDAFSRVKDTDHPVVVHIYTEKGLGLAPAVENKEAFHWALPGALDAKNENIIQTEDYTSITKAYHLRKAKEDKTYIVVNAGTPGVFGFTPDYRKELGKQYTDVGIAEEHAVAYASALANQGAKPVLHFMSSFSQRTYDQLSQDLCLNKSPITMLIYWGGISSADCTHLCIFDIPLISNIPDMVYLAPTNKEEYLAMLDWAVNQTEHPVGIRVPTAELVSTGIADTTNYSDLNKFKMTERGSKVAILGLGNFYNKAVEVKSALKSRLNIEPTLINPRFITGIDTEMLEGLKQDHDLVITLEDSVLDGGFGEKVTRFYGASDMKVLNFGAYKEFPDRVPLNELYERYHLTTDLIVEDVAEALGLLELSK
ncbi:MAG: 1-deoxy-D-xylulose-5-phosphate synthase [Cyanobacteria bacterium RUI128]|nr:1-deoxy-D-xylulose-5-phosphate synthase [Cyanobacteria bacterium RUI128]